MVLHRPIEAGMTLVSTATPVALLPRGSGSALVIHTETQTEAGELVNEQWVTEFFRGIDAGESRGEPPADHRLARGRPRAAPLAEIVQPVAHDQPNRYAEASGDHFVIHLDDDAARAVGLPGRIVHGFCTLAFTSRAVLRGGRRRPSSRRIAARFSAPVFPAARSRHGSGSSADGAYGFEASPARAARSSRTAAPSSAPDPLGVAPKSLFR